MYHIKQFSEIIGVSPESIRHYERIGILPEAHRAENGYRVYTDDDVDRLRFINRARQLDFSLDNIAEIIAFREKSILPCEYVQELITTKTIEVEKRIEELETLREELIDLHNTSQNMQLDSITECVCQILETPKMTR